MVCSIYCLRIPRIGAFCEIILQAKFNYADFFPGDPGFHYHKAVAQIWALFTARLAESPIIPLNATDYAIALDTYISKAEDRVNSAISGTETEEEALEARTRPDHKHHNGSLSDLKSSFKDLHHAVSTLLSIAEKHDAFAASLAEKAGEDIPWWKWFSKLKLYYNIRSVNNKYKFLERKFLYEPGLDSRSWFKHVVFAPGLWTGYAGAVFPGIQEAVDDKDYERALKWVGIVKSRIVAAGESLK